MSDQQRCQAWWRSPSLTSCWSWPTRRMRRCTHPLCSALGTIYSFEKLNGTSIDCSGDRTLRLISTYFPAVAWRLSGCFDFGIGCGAMPPIASYIRAPNQHWPPRRGLASIITPTPKPLLLRLSLHEQWQSLERRSRTMTSCSIRSRYRPAYRMGSLVYHHWVNKLSPRARPIPITLHITFEKLQCCGLCHQTHVR